MINQRKIANAKTHLSILYNFSYLQASQMLFHYALIYTPPQESWGFVRITRKKKCSTPDLPSFKQTMQSLKASKWKEVMQRNMTP